MSESCNNCYSWHKWSDSNLKGNCSINDTETNRDYHCGHWKRNTEIIENQDPQLTAMLVGWADDIKIGVLKLEEERDALQIDLEKAKARIKELENDRPIR